MKLRIVPRNTNGYLVAGRWRPPLWLRLRLAKRRADHIYDRIIR